jgi:hypothetical protein
MTRVLGVLFVSALLAGCGHGQRFPESPRHDVHPRFHRFRLFHAGPRFGGLPMTDDARDEIGDQYYPGRPVIFGYGFCSPPRGDENGCQLPLDISNYPACEQNLAKYTNAGLRPSRYVRVRGVRAAVFGGSRSFDKLLVTTGTTTIIVFAADAGTAIDAVRRLRSSDGRVSVHQRLPRPLPPARSRALCQARAG